MYRALVADDNHEDRELLKLEISRALSGKSEVKFYEAASIRQALDMLAVQPFDLLTLDIEFDRLSEGLDALPGIFESYPTLNIIVVSGKLDKSEVMQQMFEFTKNNILKGKRWLRHFDVLDKKDDKAEAIRTAYSFALKQSDSAQKIMDLFKLAEAHLEEGDYDKCVEVYQKIQDLAPGEAESGENIRIIRGDGLEQALEYLRKGEKLVAALLLGHHIESRLKAYTRRLMGRNWPGLFDCLKELESAHRISPYKKTLFQQLLRTRNKAIHSPSGINEQDFESVIQNLKLIEAHF